MTWLVAMLMALAASEQGRAVPETDVPWKDVLEAPIAKPGRPAEYPVRTFRPNPDEYYEIRIAVAEPDRAPDAERLLRPEGPAPLLNVEAPELPPEQPSCITVGGEIRFGYQWGRGRDWCGRRYPSAWYSPSIFVEIKLK